MNNLIRFIKFSIIINIVLLNVSVLYSNENLNDDQNLDKYNQEKITYSIEEKYDVMYPLNTKKFIFNIGDKIISFEKFLDLSKDPNLLKNEEKIKKIRLTGFSTAAIFGAVSLSFFIPSVVFIAYQTNYKPLDTSYIITGISMVALTAASVLALLIELTVTFSLLYQYKYNEQNIKEAVERYNESLKKKYNILPDFSYYKDNLYINFCLKL